jgi:hypothetical protein
MRSILITIALLSSVPAFAADAPGTTPQVKNGALLRDVNNAVLGNVSRVNSDGSLGLIVDYKFVTVPAASVTVVNGKAMTTLSKKEIVGAR